VVICLVMAVDFGCDFGIQRGQFAEAANTWISVKPTLGGLDVISGGKPLERVDRSPQNLLMCWFSVPAWSHNHTLQVAARKNTPRHLSTDGRLKSDQSRSTSFGTRSTTPSPSATDSFGAQMEMYS